MVKAEAYLAFCILSRYLNEQRLTSYAFECLLRLGHYLVTTKDLTLTVRWVPAGTELETWVDLSLGGIAAPLAASGRGPRFFVISRRRSSSQPFLLSYRGCCSISRMVVGVAMPSEDTAYAPKRSGVSRSSRSSPESSAARARASMACAAPLAKSSKSEA
jgi:hypothetical protein